MRITVGVEYDGSGFAGWQLQPHARTVQQCLEAALARVADRPVRVHGAGRTDAGVHASGQVAHFDTEAVRSPDAWVRGTNTLLPPDIAVHWAKPVPPDFHARYSAIARTYRYLILNRPVRSAVWARQASWFYRSLSLPPMFSSSGTTPAFSRTIFSS